MKYLMFLLIFPVLMMLCSCTVTPVDTPEEEPPEIYGIWVSADDNMWDELERAPELHKDKYGLIINKDGTLIERNPGSCGTPPLTYSNVSGTWKMENDSTMIVDFENNWYGQKKITIIEIKKNKLILEQEITEYSW